MLAVVVDSNCFLESCPMYRVTTCVEMILTTSIGFGSSEMVIESEMENAMSK